MQNSRTPGLNRRGLIGLAMAILAAGLVFSCETRQDKWDKSSPGKRMGGRPSDHPPGHGWNTSD
jgi:hypothetical protein